MSVDIEARDLAGIARVQARAARMGSLPRVAVCGDSFYDFATNEGATWSYWTNYSAVSWLRWRFGDRMVTRPDLVFAVGGMGSDHLLAVQLPRLLASGADLVLVNMGTNDVGKMLAADTRANVTAFVRRCAARGIGIVWNTVVPQDSFNNASFRQIHETNEQLARLAADPANRLWLVDLYPAMVDFATGKCVAGLLVGDGVHPGIAGCVAMADAIAPVLDRLLPPAAVLPTYSASHLYDAALSPGGNIIRGGLFQNGSGNATGGATGTVASFWQGIFGSTGGSTLTAAFAKGIAPGTAGLPTQVVTIGGTADGNSIVLEAKEESNGGGLLTMPAGVGEGARLEATMRVSWSGLLNVGSIRVRLSHDVGAATVEHWDGASGTIGASWSPGVLPAERSGVILRPAPITLPTGFDNVRLRLTIATRLNGQPAAGTVTVQQAALRVV